MRFMRVVFGIILAGVLVATIMGCQPASSSPGTVTDDAGRAVTITKVPQRIVSHVPSATEILFAIGDGDRIVGVSSYDDYPPEAKTKTNIGNYYNPSMEKIISVNPDLVVTDGSSTDISPLDNAGIKYVTLYPKSIDGIMNDITLLGKVTGSEPKADALVKDMKAQIATVTNKAKDAPKVKVFYMFDVSDLNNPWTTGPGSFMDSMITMSGGTNIAGNATSPYVKYSIEQIVASNPDIIIVATRMGSSIITTEQLKAHPVWGKLPAVVQGKVYNVDGDIVNRPGPRIVQGLNIIAKFIHPELFK